jgi:hypothetical protein
MYMVCPPPYVLACFSHAVFAGDQLQASCPEGNEPEWHKLYAAWFREVRV